MFQAICRFHVTVFDPNRSGVLSSFENQFLISIKGIFRLGTRINMASNLSQSFEKLFEDIGIHSNELLCNTLSPENLTLKSL
jgi:hypothetical protein